MPITQSLNSKANVKKSTNNDLPFSPQQPVINAYTAVSTSAQTSISNLGFTVDTVNNPEVFLLWVNGVLLTRGQDYNFSGVAADGTSSSITLLAALPANLNIKAVKLGLKPENQFAMDNRFTQLYEAEGAGFQAFVKTSDMLAATTTTGTPAAGAFYSTISNRASIVDISQDLKVNFGIDRMMFQQIFQVPNEVGPNNEQVWATPNDLFGRVRFIGPWVSTYDSNGSRPYLPGSISVSTDGVEITFYGTGINLLMLNTSSALTLAWSVDGGASSGTLAPGSNSTVINSRNYAINQPVPVVSGLTLGVHTLKVTKGTSAYDFNLFGVEVINANTSGLLKVNPGTSYLQGQKRTLSGQSSPAYNSAVTGVRGGRTLVYQNADGSIGQSFQATNSSSAFLSSADHTNEELARTYYYREFGAFNGNDFSSLTNSNANCAFTLDDGTTTLLGNTVRNGATGDGEVVLPNAAGAFIQFTFVGTGLDIIRASDTGSGAMDSNTVYVDGVSVGSLGSLGLYDIVNYKVNQKIVSGLPYGTHTVKFLRNAAVSSIYQFYGFKVYQPKKPSIPTGAMELSDYNVMATYVANTTPGPLFSGTGILKKEVAIREATFAGSWTVSAVDVNNSIAGFNTSTTSAGSYFELPFFGTGVDYRFYQINASTNFTVAIYNLDTGSTVALNTATTSLYYTGSGLSFNSSTGVVSGTPSANAPGAGLSISALPMGAYKLRVTQNLNSAANVYAHEVDVITPVHSLKSNLYSDLQNTLPIGSQSTNDSRKITPIKDVQLQKKARIQALGIVASPTTSSTVFVPMPDMSVSIKTISDFIDVSWSIGAYSNVSGGTVQFQLYVDGVAFGPTQLIWNVQASAIGESGSRNLIVPVSPGFHKIDLYWASGTGTVTAQSTDRSLTVKEI